MEQDLRNQLLRNIEYYRKFIILFFILFNDNSIEVISIFMLLTSCLNVITELDIFITSVARSIPLMFCIKLSKCLIIVLLILN